MSAHLLRHADGTVSNIMTTTAAQPNSAGNITIDRSPSASSAGHDAIAPAGQVRGANMREERKQKVDKKSPEYLIKSGLAGGFAGCAVCLLPLRKGTPCVRISDRN
jgi:solute carrier family 25 protein 16